MNNLPRGLMAIWSVVLAVTVAGFAAETTPTSPVKISARVMLIEGALSPSAKEALAALDAGGDSGRKAIVLTKARADSALAELTKTTGAKVYAMEPTPETGKLRVGIDLYPRDPAAHRVGITVAGRVFEPTDDTWIELDAVPQVAADGSIQLQATVRMPVFVRFVYYEGKEETVKGATPVPGAFYQPVFSHFSLSASGRLHSGETLVLRGEITKPLRMPSGDGEWPKPGSPPTECVILVFVTAEIAAAGNP